MTHRGRLHYLTQVRIGQQVILSIVWARNAEDAAAITARAEGGSLQPVEIDALPLISDSAYRLLRRWFKRPYVRLLQGGQADHLVSWRFAFTGTDDYDMG